MSIFINRLTLCLTIPFIWSWRLVQSRMGFPVDMGEFHREIVACWRWHPEER